jgi:hypothetical protein
VGGGGAGTAALKFLPPRSFRQVDPLIRQLNLYRNLIEERTKEKSNS